MRIEQLQLDELSMEDSTGTEVAIQFNYDNLFIATDIPFENTEYNLEQITGRDGLYPLHYNGFGTKITNGDVTGNLPSVTQSSSGGFPQDLIGGVSEKLQQVGDDVVDNIQSVFATEPALSPLGEDFSA